MAREIKEILDDIGARLRLVIIDELKKYPSLTHSNIVNEPDSITWETTDGNLTMRLPQYSAWIDQGRGVLSKMPPMQDGQGNFPIRDWMLRKGTRENKPWMLEKKKNGNGELKAEYGMRLHIKNNPMEARPFLDASLNKFLPDIYRGLNSGFIFISKLRLERILKKLNR